MDPNGYLLDKQSVNQQNKSALKIPITTSK